VATQPRRTAPLYRSEQLAAARATGRTQFGFHLGSRPIRSQPAASRVIQSDPDLSRRTTSVKSVKKTVRDYSYLHLSTVIYTSAPSIHPLVKIARSRFPARSRWLKIAQSKSVRPLDPSRANSTQLDRTQPKMLFSFQSLNQVKDR
jgi:hypothetical protein